MNGITLDGRKGRGDRFSFTSMRRDVIVFVTSSVPYNFIIINSEILF